MNAEANEMKIEEATGIHDKLDIDRSNCKRLGITRPEVVYTAVLKRLNGSRTVGVSDRPHLAHLYVLSNLVEMKSLSQDAMTDIILASTNNFEAGKLVPVLWHLAFERDRNTEAIRKLLMPRLEEDGLISRLTLSQDFRANLENPHFSSFMFDLVSGALQSRRFTAQESILLFWGIHAPN